MSNSIRVKIILAENLLRRPFTADGPIRLEGMFEVGYPKTCSTPSSRPARNVLTTRRAEDETSCSR
jgi:hypothetical protein